MKKLLFALAVSALAWGACKNDGAEGGVQSIPQGTNSTLVRNPATADMPLDSNELARISYKEKEYDFGTAKEGDIITHEFEFTNTGKVPLVITNCRSTCGCTVPEWPEEPIPPGGTGKILAKFNTEGKSNRQSKMIYVTGNTYPNESRVTLTGMVEPK